MIQPNVRGDQSSPRLAQIPEVQQRGEAGTGDETASAIGGADARRVERTSSVAASSIWRTSLARCGVRSG